jgi:uncharacterized protein
MNRIAVLISGLLFGAGLTISGMVNPVKILNFLDITGSFDPTLIFVMGAGLLVTAIGYQFLFRREKPFFAPSFQIPKLKHVDLRLISGAVLFGLGWGLSGFCPGPAIASLVFGHSESVIFVAAMAMGMLLTRLVPARR